MSFRTDDSKTTCGLDFRRKLDVGTTARHIRGYGHGAGQTGLCDDLRLSGVLLGIEDIVLDAPHPEHTAQELGSLHVSGTDQNRTAFLDEFLHLIDHGGVFRLLCLINKVILIVPDHRTVRRDDNHIQLVDGPELTGLRLGRTGHTGQFVVHSEIVLEGDGRECLCGGLDLDVLLRLDSLVQTIAPAAAFHNTACLLIHNLDLVVDDDVVNVLLEHSVGLEELDHSVHTLALQRIILHQGILLLLLLLGGEFSVLLDLGDLASNVRKHEEIRIGNGVGQQVVTLVGHIDRVLLLADHEIQLVGDDVHLTLVVLHIIVLSLLHQLLHTLLAEELDQRLVLRKSLVGTQEKHSTLVLLSGRDSLLGIVQDLGHESALLLVEALDVRPELHILLVILSLGHRTGYDQRSTRVINEHGVHLIDDGIVMLPLDEVCHIHCHIVTKVVKTELVVRTESDVAVVGSLASVAVRLVLVDAVHRKAVEHIERSHPLGVTL